MQEISSQIIVRPQKSPKVIMGSSENFNRKLDPSDTYTRPLMVNAWAQTTNDDFEFLLDLKHKEEQTKREIELQEKIRVLEENLKAHAELLSQIHETSARTSALLGQPSPPPFQLVNPTQIQNLESQFSNQAAQKIKKMHPDKSNCLPSHNNSVINPLHSLGSTNTDSVNYTIIAEGTDTSNGEPIEVQLAEEDGALNLNSSADSGRLEICLASDDNTEAKTKAANAASHYSTADNTLIKKRKLEVLQAETTNYHYTGQSLLKSSDGNNRTMYNFPKQPQSTPKMTNNNGLRKSWNNASNIQTTPIHTLMKSPLNGASAAAGAAMERKIDSDYVMVSIGPNDTKIPAKVYEGMSWSSPSIATRKLLMAVFDRKTLATHSMTGKPSPAFKEHNKPLKQMLDPVAIQDIIFAVTRKCNVSEKEVRNAITTKCADENKMMKLQQNKRTPMREQNKENIATENVNKIKSES